MTDKSYSLDDGEPTDFSFGDSHLVLKHYFLCEILFELLLPSLLSVVSALLEVVHSVDPLLLIFLVVGFLFNLRIQLLSDIFVKGIL